MTRIPEPTAADLDMDLNYEHGHALRQGNIDYAGLVRRCHAAESRAAELAGERDRLLAGEMDAKHKAVKASTELAEVADLRKRLDLSEYNAAGYKRLADHMTAQADALRSSLAAAEADAGRLREALKLTRPALLYGTVPHDHNCQCSVCSAADAALAGGRP